VYKVFSNIFIYCSSDKLGQFVFKVYFFDSFSLKVFCDEITLEKVASIIVETLSHLFNQSIEVQSQVHFAHALSIILSTR
jgi:hypothetical protein